MTPSKSTVRGRQQTMARTTSLPCVLRRIGFLAAAWGLLVSAPAFAQPRPAPTLPGTVAGTRVAGWLAAFNSGDDAQMRQYLADNLAPEAIARAPIEERLASMREMRTALGKLELRKVVQSVESRVVVVVASGDEFEQLDFEFEPQPPHRFLRMRGQSADNPDLPPPSRVSEPEALVAIEKAVAEAVAADQFSGTVLVAREGKPLLLKSWGLASVEHNVPNRTDTKYNLGSINKLFTRLAIGQLVQAGKLSFDDTLGKVLPDYPSVEARQKVTVRHLLDMSSGIGDFFGERFEATPKDRVRTIRDYLPLFADKPLEFKPGTQARYSNGGYVVLGAIIEKASGQDYYAYVREHLFKPLGMASTDSYEADASVPNLAMGYTRPGPSEPRRSNIYTRPARGSSAGGGYSTAEDMLRFGLALQRGALLKPETVRAVFGEMWPAAPGKELLEGRISGGWTGGAPGINAALETDARAGTTIVVLANLDPPSAGRVAKKIRPWLERPAR